MVNNVQVAAARCRRTATRIDDATEAPHGFPFGLVEGAAAGLPARPGRRRPGTEVPGKLELNANFEVIGIERTELARLTKAGPRRQRLGVYADQVRAHTAKRPQLHKAVGIRIATSELAIVGSKYGA